MIVAIDGPAGTGKSTIARMVAEGLGFTYVNSGSIYRAMTLRALRHGVDAEDAEAIVACSRQARVEYRNGRLFLDGEDAEAELRSSPVDALVAQQSAIPALREIVNELVRRISGSTDAVVEGRDMTTVVFPDADAKFYLDASVDARAKRRFDQGASDASLGDIRRNIEMRDTIDRSKSVGALKIAPDAEYLDSSHLTIQQVYDKVYGKILHLREHHGR
jgi:cytidylate kinase/small subunit ribosomal protein S1